MSTASIILRHLIPALQGIQRELADLESRVRPAKEPQAVSPVRNTNADREEKPRRRRLLNLREAAEFPQGQQERALSAHFHKTHSPLQDREPNPAGRGKAYGVDEPIRLRWRTHIDPSSFTAQIDDSVGLRPLLGPHRARRSHPPAVVDRSSVSKEGLRPFWRAMRSPQEVRSQADWNGRMPAPRGHQSVSDGLRPLSVDCKLPHEVARSQSWPNPAMGYILSGNILDFPRRPERVSYPQSATKSANSRTLRRWR